MITKLIQTIITLGKVVFRSNFSISFEKSADENVIVLANGPSLKNDILNNQSLFESSHLAAVNHFCHSEFFLQLKPHSYFMLDPAFFMNDNFNENVERTFRVFDQEVDWNMELYIPYRRRKSKLVRDLQRKENITVRLVNYVPAKGGFPKINYKLFNMDLATQQCQNVIIFALFMFVKRQTKQVFLFGAENDWHANVSVNRENQLVLQDNHLYEEKKEHTVRILFDPVDPAKRRTMVELLESCVKVFKGYDEVAAYAQTRNVRIYNCSKNSLIDAFERLDDEEFRKTVAS